ncbi:MAG: hypothetical protein H7145_08315 [Akkermansiaceae bacterium]|nr:hypothetical protein [Armatimonadota bacterium]
MPTPPAENLTEWIDSLDPALREAAWGYLHGLMKPFPPTGSLSNREHDLRDKLLARSKTLPTDALVPRPVIAMVTVFLMVVAHGFAGPFLAAMVLLLGFLLGYSSYSQEIYRRAGNENTTKTLVKGFLADALCQVYRTRTEHTYCDAVRELCPRQAGKEGVISADLRREQMTQLNALLDSGRRLDAVRAEIANVLATASVETLRAEADALRQRQEQSSDPGTRSAFAQSLALCEERLRRAESLDSLTERIEAEQELVYQAFRAAQSSIASLRVSPAAAGIDAATGTTAVAGVAETIGRQTRAVEAAVQELGIRY